MSHNNAAPPMPPRGSDQNKRGKKRNASFLLTTDQGQDNTINPRSPKRQKRESYDQTMQQLLTMPASQLSVLPEPLRLQAIKLRKARNISNGEYDVSNNNNNQNNQTNLPVFNFNNNQQQHQRQQQQQQQKQDDKNGSYQDSSDDEEESQDEEEKDVQEAPPQYNRVTVPVTSQPVISQPVTSTGYRPYQQSQPSQYLSSQQNVNLQPGAQFMQQQQYNNRQTNQPPQQVFYGNNDRNPAPQQVPIYTQEPNIENNVSSSNPAPQTMSYADTQELITQSKPKGQPCSLFGLLILLVVAMIFGAPIKNTIPLPRQYGTKYCDTQGTSIKVQSNTQDCVPCPIDAVECFNGKARCQNGWYWVDPDLDKCVERDYPKIFMIELKGQIKRCMDIGMKFFESMKEHGYDAIQLKEWENWYDNFQKMNFKEKCKSLEMEIMILFFVLSWKLPALRCLIILIWARMLKSYNQDNGMEIKYSLEALSYFSGLMFVGGLLKMIGLM